MGSGTPVKNECFDDIAAELGIASTTVKTHLTRIFEKLGVENRTSMVSWINQIDVS